MAAWVVSAFLCASFASDNTSHLCCSHFPSLDAPSHFHHPAQLAPTWHTSLNLARLFNFSMPHTKKRWRRTRCTRPNDLGLRASTRVHCFQESLEGGAALDQVVVCGPRPHTDLPAITQRLQQGDQGGCWQEVLQVFRQIRVGRDRRGGLPGHRLATFFAEAAFAVVDLLSAGGSSGPAKPLQ